MENYYSSLLSSIDELRQESAKNLLLARNKIVSELEMSEQSLRGVYSQVESLHSQLKSVEEVKLTTFKTLSDFNQDLSCIKEGLKLIHIPKSSDLTADPRLASKLANLLEAMEMYKLEVQPHAGPPDPNSFMRSRESELTFGQNSPEHL